MTRFRWFVLAVSTATVAAVISFGANGLAATHRAHSNYPGPPQVTAAAKTVHRTNYRGPAQQMTRISGTHVTNGPA